MKAEMNRVGAITIFVADLARSRSFYHEVFGGPLIFQDDDSAVFDFDGMMVNLLESSAAIDLVEPETVAGRSAGSRVMLSIWVDNVDASCAELTGRGVDLLNSPIDREWGKRTASFTDPDGNIWEIAQDIPAAANS